MAFNGKKWQIIQLATFYTMQRVHCIHVEILQAILGTDLPDIISLSGVGIVFGSVRLGSTRIDSYKI